MTPGLVVNQEPYDEQRQVIQKLEDGTKMQQIRNEKWDEYYMKIACLTALRSKDPSTPVRLFTALPIQCHKQVGACVVDKKEDKIVGFGYNSMPYIEDDDNDSVFPWKGEQEEDKEDTYWQVHPELKHAYGN